MKGSWKIWNKSKKKKKERNKKKLGNKNKQKREIGMKGGKEIN